MLSRDQRLRLAYFLIGVFLLACSVALVCEGTHEYLCRECRGGHRRIAVRMAGLRDGHPCVTIEYDTVDVMPKIQVYGAKGWTVLEEDDGPKTDERRKAA